MRMHARGVRDDKYGLRCVHTKAQGSCTSDIRRMRPDDDDGGVIVEEPCAAVMCV